MSLQSRGAPIKIDLSVRLFAYKNQTTPERIFKIFFRISVRNCWSTSISVAMGGGKHNWHFTRRTCISACPFGLHIDTHQAKQRKIKINHLLPSYCIETSFAITIRTWLFILHCFYKHFRFPPSPSPIDCKSFVRIHNTAFCQKWKASSQTRVSGVLPGRQHSRIVINRQKTGRKRQNF